MMNFIPSKMGHEELESQGKQSTKSITNLNLPQSSTYLNNIRGDEDSNEGHLSEEDEFQENERYLNQYQQNYIMDQQNMHYNSYPYQYHQENYQNQGYQGGQVKQIISPKGQQTKFLGHTQSMSMKENLPQRNYGVAKSSTSPFRTKLGREQKENQHLQQQQQQRSANSISNIKSFEKSYQELTQQILSQRLENVQQNNYSLRPQDLLLGQQQLQELQKRKNLDQKTQEELFNRLNKEAELQNDYKHQLALEQQKKEMEQCTFAPQTYSTRPEEQRTLNQFLEDQEKFQKQQSEKINMLRYQIQEEKNQNTTHQPRINQKSEMIVQMKRVEKEPVYDRLYKISQEKSNRTSDVRASNQVNGLQIGGNKYSSRNSNSQFNQTQRASEYEQELEQQNTFQPQINEKSKMMVRKGKVGDHLYQDALRRQEKVNTIQSQQESIMTKQQKSTMSNQTNKIISSRSEQIVATKFVREFESVCDEILHDPNSQKIDYLQMGEILNRLHFLKNVGDESNLNNLGSERKLVYDIWYNLRGDELGGVTKCNLCQFLLIVIGIFSFQLQTEDQLRQMQLEQNQNNMNNANFAHPLQNDTYNKMNHQQHNTLYLQERYTEEEDEDYDPSNPYYQQRQQLTVQQQLNEFNQGNDSFQVKLQQYNQKNRKGFIDQIGNWNIPVEEAKCLQKEFDILYRNRLSNEELKKTDFKQDSTFQPQINQNSKKLAENYREKLLEETANLISNQEIQVRVPPSGKITHVDLLVFQKQAQLQERQKKNQAQNLAVQQSCTFHPQTLPSSNSLVSKNNLNNQSGQINNSGSNASLVQNQCGVKKSQQLYQLSKLKNGKKDKDKNEIEYEKNFDECTFQPDIAITRSKSSNALRKSHVSTVSITTQRDSDKYIERMRAANKQREEKNIMLQRGYNKPDANDKKKTDKTAPVSSRLYNDVPLYRQSKQNNSNEQQATQENQSNSEQIQQYGEGSQTQEYSQYQQFMMNQKQTEQSYDFMNNQQDSYGLYSYNQDGEDNQHLVDQNNVKNSEIQGQQFQYNQIQPINPLEKVPLLFVDVNLGREKTERIIVFEGDTSDALAAKFAEEYNLDSQMKLRLKELLDSQIAGLLTKIDEEEAPSMMSD